MDVMLTDPERKLLVRLLEGSLGDLRSEVRRTRTPEWHDSLKEEERILREVLRKIRTN